MLDALSPAAARARPAPRRRPDGRARRPARGHPAGRPDVPSRAPDVALPGLDAARARHQPGLPERRGARRSANMAELSALVGDGRGRPRDRPRGRVGRQLGQPRLGARQPPTSAGSTTSASASRSCSGGNRSTAARSTACTPTRSPSSARSSRSQGQAVAAVGRASAQTAFGDAARARGPRHGRAGRSSPSGRQDVDPDGLDAARRRRDPRRQQRPPGRRRRRPRRRRRRRARLRLDYAALLRAMTSPFVSFEPARVAAATG